MKRLWAVAICLLIAPHVYSSGNPVPYLEGNYSPMQSKYPTFGLSSKLKIHIDHDTGCHYLSVGDSGVLTPRMASGHGPTGQRHVCGGQQSQDTYNAMRGAK